MERELALEEFPGKDPPEMGGRARARASLTPVNPSKSNPEGPASPPVGVSGAGVEHDPIRMAAFSSSLFFRQAALGFRCRSFTYEKQSTQ